MINAEQLGAKLVEASRPLVFTNGCFDILHRGHVCYLEEAAALGRSLLVAVNSDDSVRRLGKGAGRPINTLEDRMAVLAALDCVNFVLPFSEDTPLELIKKVRPDFLVKGGDWTPDAIVGATEVRAYGGQVVSIPIRFQRSTTELIAELKSAS
ncbi:MAG: D-glycero-beta-D-manno-heptose 1-phosphate adenylyltransferase [Gammaproteobacteria bacterium]|nr:D-glycero-beta-D-manno-heptose 1-phosphate adenylyltransferase [Gammaproteobacteria bacterium]